MFKKFFFLVLLVAMSAWGNFCRGEQEVIKETVSVVNVEVPVRVHLDGKPVMDLKKEDFAVYEDGKPQDINGFQQIKKKIARASKSRAGMALPPSRYFVLTFRVFDFNDALKDGLAYVFDNILSPQDQLLVLINDKTRIYPDLADARKIRAEIGMDLRDQCHRTHNAILANLKELDDWIHTIQTAWETGNTWASRPTMIQEFLKRYLESLILFKNRYMSQDIDKYYYFAQHLDKVRKEKWVLNFCQQEILPHMRFNGEMMRIVQEQISACAESNIPEYKMFYVMLTQLVQQIENESKTGVAFPVEEISKLFFKVNATFHTIFINTQFDYNSSIHSNNIEFQPIATGIQTNLRDLTEKTGGKLIASSDIVSSLAIITEAMDSYYLLTYAPVNSSKIGTINVKTSNKKYNVLYDDNLRADYINEYLKNKEAANPTVKIKGISFIDRTLAFSLQDYELTKIKFWKAGMLNVRIRVSNSANQVFFDQTKVLKAGNSTFNLSLKFDFLAAGKYDIVVDVLDQVSGKTCSEIVQPLIE
jgi:VWFA-related protein